MALAAVQRALRWNKISFLNEEQQRGREWSEKGK